MRILVTGGAGFIGSNFIRYVLKRYREYKIVNLDKLTYCGNLENLRDVEDSKNYTFVKGDICDEKTVKKVVKGCAIILNFAAETHVDRSIVDPSSFIRTNVYGTYVLLEAAKKYRVRRFIQISTDEVYGSILRGAFREEDPLRPNSPYSASKAAGDMLARSYYVTYKLPVIVVRSSNNFGPYQYPEKIIPLFITNALGNKKVPLYADGMNVRDWLYVIDNCKAIGLILRRGSAGEIYNVGGGNEVSNLELTNAILELLDKRKTLIKFVKDRPGHDKRYALDIRKVKALGWSPHHDYTLSLKSTIEWYKENRTWWERLKKRRKERC